MPSQTQDRPFYRFTWTPIPHYFIDHMMADMDPSAVVVLLLLAREAYAFTDRDGRCTLTLEQICNGSDATGDKPAFRGTGLSRSTVKRAIDVLMGKGLVGRQEHRNANGISFPNTYSLLFQDSVAQKFNLNQGGSMGEPQGGSMGEPQGSMGEPLFVAPPDVAPENKNTEPTSEPISNLNYPQENAPETEPEEREFITGNDAYLAVKRELSSHRGFSPSQQDRRKLKANLAEVSIRADLVEPVVAHFVEWVGRQPRPIAPSSVTGGHMLKLLMGEESLDVDSAPPPRRPPASEPAPARRKPPASEPTPPSNGIPPLAERWNAVSPEHLKVESWSTAGKDNANLLAACRDKGFTESLDKTLAWCQAVWKAGHSKLDYVTFSWFIKPGVWNEILIHKHDYLLKPEKSDKPKALSIEERLQRAIAFRPESEYKGK